jgi:hypothetical protein
MSVIDQANTVLCRYRDAALTVAARRLLADGVDADAEEFRSAMLEYAGRLESWRCAGMRRIQRFVDAATVQRDDSTAVH